MSEAQQLALLIAMLSDIVSRGRQGRAEGGGNEESRMEETKEESAS